MVIFTTLVTPLSLKWVLGRKGDKQVGKQKDQHTVGTPEKLRGQQTGFKGNPDQNREEMDNTPALRGNRQNRNKMFSDASRQHTGTSSATPSTNQPSTPGMRK
jgi:hypothetical protein